jgi:hypothetical protein
MQKQEQALRILNNIASQKKFSASSLFHQTFVAAMSSPTPKIRVARPPTSKSRRKNPPWHSYLTIDLLSTVLLRTFLHPFFAWMIPLSLRAVTVPYDYLSMRLAIGYASILSVIYILLYVNDRIAFGLPREVDLEEEIIVITGGASGLGRIVAEIYAMKGTTVAVLDVKKWVDQGVPGVNHYLCDVGEKEQVDATAKKIRDDVSREGSIPIRSHPLQSSLQLEDSFLPSG